MLHNDALENVIDKVQFISSSNVGNMISSFWNNKKSGGEIDWILYMKGCAKMECIHDSVFLRQGQKKVYLLMLMHELGGGVNFIQQMQPRDKLQNCFVMFNHVKREKSWIKMHITSTTPLIAKS